MSNTPLVSHAGTARARAGIAGDPDLVAATAADLRQALALAALDRADLDQEQREVVAVALITGTVADALAGPAVAPLTPELRARAAAALTGTGDTQ